MNRPSCAGAERHVTAELLTTMQMRAAEADAMASGTSGARLMERAGRAVADAVQSRLPHGRALVLCGPGNNGGDGYVVARVLKDRGFRVEVFALVPVVDLQGDARLMAEAWDGPVHPPRRFVELVQESAEQETVTIDALFGTGLTRAIAGDAALMVAHANALPGVKIAVDIPSGVDSDTGEVRGAAFEADETITFHAMKPGHVLPPGCRLCGDVAVADIGLGAQATARARLAADGPEIDLNDGTHLLTGLGRDLDAHKYTKGQTLVLAGGLEGAGAARLAAHAALRVGAGLVTLGVPPSALLAHASRPPDALMLRRCDGEVGLAELLEDQRRNAIVIGPAYGVGEATRQAVLSVLATRRPTVLDADALTSFEGHLGALAGATRATGNVVLTPHDGEFARLFPIESRDGGEKPRNVRPSNRNSREKPGETLSLSATSRLHRALEAAALTAAVVVLKGPATIIAAPDGRCAINTNAPPWLATAGSGDVLSGLIGGLLSQGLGPFDAARAAVWLHGAAGQAAGRGVIADDLPEMSANILKNM